MRDTKIVVHTAFTITFIPSFSFSGVQLMENQVDEQHPPMKPSKSMTRSKSFTAMECLSAEDQDAYLNALRISRYYNKVFGDDKPLPAPTRFSKNTPRASPRGNHSEKASTPDSSPESYRQLRRSVSEPVIHEVTVDTTEGSEVVSRNEVQEVSIATDLLTLLFNRNATS